MSLPSFHSGPTCSQGDLSNIHSSQTPLLTPFLKASMAPKGLWNKTQRLQLFIVCHDVAPNFFFILPTTNTFMHIASAPLLSLYHLCWFDLKLYLSGIHACPHAFVHRCLLSTYYAVCWGCSDK